MNTIDKLTTGLRQTLEKSGLSGYVLGLSGGVDSAVSAALCARAVGRENVRAFFLPYKLSSEISRKDACEVAASLNISLEEVDISPMADAYAAMTPDLSAYRLGNVLARLRMTVLFDKSAEHSSLVAGTSNRSEGLLGYTTWFGDSASSVNPIGKLYKTQVWEMARALNLPESVITKAPTADLREGQTDEADLGYGYPEIDKLLSYIYDQGRSAQDAVDAGFDKDFVRAITTRVEKNRFKSEVPKILDI